jgi:hypothetical protein
MGVTAVNTERGDLDKVLAGVKTVIDAARAKKDRWLLTNVVYSYLEKECSSNCMSLPMHLRVALLGCEHE